MFEPLSDNDRELAEATSGNASELIEKLPTRHNGRYEYYDDKGDLCFVVQRYKKNGKKRFGSYTPIQAENAKTCWLKSLKVDGLRPLYRLPALLEHDPKCSIMVVEGEKCVEAVLNNSTKAFPITWDGGTSPWQKTSWSPLYGRPLILVADGGRAWPQGHESTCRSPTSALSRYTPCPPAYR